MPFLIMFYNVESEHHTLLYKFWGNYWQFVCGLKFRFYSLSSHHMQFQCIAHFGSLLKILACIQCEVYTYTYTYIYSHKAACKVTNLCANKMCFYKDKLELNGSSFAFYDFKNWQRLCLGALTSWTVCIQAWKQYFGSLSAFPTTNPSL